MELERKKRRDYHAGTGRGLEKSSVDYLPPEKCNQNHQQRIRSNKYMQEKKKGISVGVVGAEGAKLPRISCEGCEEQIRAAQRQVVQRSRVRGTADLPTETRENGAC